ncbi:MAG: nicotinate-nucleotide adenylyltransferase [Thiothrix sp.]|nr:MAG: nicotinate-nucleotide adenylyltransferase [Thiothrix sp.]
MIGIIGGTFDPIHLGHLRTALEIAESCGMEQMRFIPGSVPPHRPQPKASAEQRWEMVNLAIAGEPLFAADRRELERQGNSYTVDTLASLRDDLGAKTPLAFVLGMDAFLAFRSWHRWQDIMQLAHLVVMSRPGYAPDPHDWYGELLAQTTCELRSTAAGRVTFLSVTQLDISATQIRAACKNNKSIRFLLPEAVCHYIQEHSLYS